MAMHSSAGSSEQREGEAASSRPHPAAVINVKGTKYAVGEQPWCPLR